MHGARRLFVGRSSVMGVTIHPPGAGVGLTDGISRLHLKPKQGKEFVWSEITGIRSRGVISTDTLAEQDAFETMDDAGKGRIWNRTLYDPKFKLGS